MATRHVWGWWGIGLTCLLFQCGCSSAESSPADIEFQQTSAEFAASSDDVPQARQREFEEQLLAIAQSYSDYALVNDSYTWANERCDLVNPAEVTSPFVMSSSPDGQTHGRKLFLLYARYLSETRSYVTPEGPASVGQVLVKESWLPGTPTDRIESPQPPIASEIQQESEVATPSVTDSMHLPQTKSALFIMFKLPPETEGTDEGWVYGTVTGDGRQVTSAGRVTTCMNCHLEAPHDRLFGLSR